MHWTPHPPDTLVHTHHILAADQLILAPRIAHEELRLLQYLLLLQVPHTHGLGPAVDVIRLEDGVVIRARGDAEFDAREAPRQRGQERRGEEVALARRGYPVVAVREVEAAALQDEGAEAVLTSSVRCVRGGLGPKAPEIESGRRSRRGLDLPVRSTRF